MNNQLLIDKTIAFVKKELEGAEGGHDWFHIQRVYTNARTIAKGEKVDSLTVALGALLHDIADAKFHDGDETVGPRIARDFMKSIDVDKAVISHVIRIMENSSFKNSLEKKGDTTFTSPELQVVQDADRLDAIGAIGIARAFNYGGFKNRELYNPAIVPNLNMTKEEYKKTTAPTINHFYEKLLLLKDRMNTETGKEMAEKRHRFMLDFLEQFYKEWEGR
ncbi:HD domain-containing protein [Flavobacteriaceae bacterium TP-CH-4]|uniref:HD domain-containing protein n=1 Tax=Pelagihabitans pacificus TaxID=2696054 RepID=A0A967AWK2_9FLAO|nr:HD domain-containing protein [Pelagihabitans pacificus]NHF60463.1 HD domain-containing protein [Pelagihabitans pacificus]